MWNSKRRLLRTGSAYNRKRMLFVFSTTDGASSDPPHKSLVLSTLGLRFHFPLTSVSKYHSSAMPIQ